MRLTYDVTKEIKAQLFAYKGMKKRLIIAKEKLKELEQYTGIKGVSFNCYNSSGSTNSNPFLKNIEIRNQLKEEIIDLEVTVNNIELAMNELESNSNVLLYEMIEQRYFQSKSINEVCTNINIDRSTYYRWEQTAYEIIKKYMPK